MPFIHLKVHFTPARRTGREDRVRILLHDANEEAVAIGNNESAEEMDEGMGIPRDWEIPRGRLTICPTVVGEGEFGMVKRGFYESRDGRKLMVAVKLLKGTVSHTIMRNPLVVLLVKLKQATTRMIFRLTICST